ncbi:serine hydrolase domain-containing protein [Caulobacter sp.]|uniref:serine hydrolase domain-containing protein n=1 Tax=Caulobacter sp. TaxID=78 RepID=UPI002B4893D4|nr:serine hydrolase domain-containing protein [Caulobacter sp.]HJV40549.1 serine hydrolase domain-containing protein [Caulobacter sp.]
MGAHPALLIAAIAALWSAHPAPSHASGAEAPDPHHRIDALFAAWDGQDTPGCAVGVSRDGVLDYARGYGMSNLEFDVPITPGSVFHVASISKQFTAFSIGLLAQDGKLSMDDDIRKYLPEMTNIERRITIANLIHHTDGLREQGQLLNLAGWRGDDLYTQDDVLWALSRQRNLNFEPGTEVVYGNAAYTLLAVIVQRVSGQSLRAFADTRIFRPLAMTDSHFRDDHTEPTRGRAAAYAARSGGGWSISIPNIDHYGSTSLLTTVGDLLKWEQNLIDGRVGGKALVGWMRTSGALNDGTKIGYGGGLRLAEYRGLPVVSHDGADGGYRAEATLFPDQGLAIVALCNGAAITPTELTRKVAEIYLSDHLAPPTLAPAVATPAVEQSALAGTYWSAQTDEVVRLEWKDGALRQVGSPVALVPIGGGAYRPGDLSQEWRFIPPAAGAPAGSPPELRIRDFWPTHRAFVRVALPAPTASALDGLVGRYRSEETDMTYTVSVADGRLSLTWPRGYEVSLQAIGGDRFVGSQGTVTFTRKPSGEVDGLTISNRRLRRLRAERAIG